MHPIVVDSPVSWHGCTLPAYLHVVVSRLLTDRIDTLKDTDVSKQRERE